MPKLQFLQRYLHDHFKILYPTIAVEVWLTFMCYGLTYTDEWIYLSTLVVHIAIFMSEKCVTRYYKRPNNMINSSLKIFSHTIII